MSDHATLLRMVRSVRNRWRARVVLRGLAIVLFSAVALFIVAGYAVDASRFDAATVAAARVLSYLAFAAVLLWVLARPLTRRVSDERVALYLEEHEPTLEGRVISALELGRQPERSASPALVERLMRSAIDACREVDSGRRVERTELWRSGSMAAGSTALGLGLMLAGPAFLHRTTPLLLDPWKDSGTVNPYRILVEPGDATVARGADLTITASLEGFEAAEVELAVRPEGAPRDGWRLWPMLREEAHYNLIVFDLEQPTEYYVEARGVRSPVYRIDVMELPYVEDIHLTYRFPAYTDLEPLEQAGSGDIAALTGTVVELSVTPTLAVTGGAIELESDRESAGGTEWTGTTLPLTLANNGQLTGSLTVSHPGRYRILLGDPAARGATEGGPKAYVVASPDYLIDPLNDQPPIVEIAKPGRDVQASNLEEVAIEVRARDDYGVSRLELVYAVNGGEERSQRLYRGQPGRKDFTGSHTLFLEELEGVETGGLLEPGDLVSYYGRAFDAANDETVSDIYFLEIRGFDRSFRQADQSGTGGQGMSGAELTAQQRLIIAATFKLSRAARAHDDDPAPGGGAEDIATVALSQGRLREQVEALVERLETRRGMTAAIDEDSPVATMVELLPRAAAEMTAAEESLGEHRPDRALAPEQKALQLLQRAEAAFTDVQVAEGQGGGGGGGGDIRDELQDLVEQERDRLRNQYEQVQRGDRQRRDDTIDETLERLRELARRQQQENERLRARARQADRGAGAGSSGRSQRQLAEETQEVARKLERLARQQSSPELAETARRLREAAEAMRRAAAAGKSGESLANSALDRLREARKQLERGRSGRLERDIRQATHRSRQLREQQRRMVDRVDRLDPDDDEALDAIHETKESMAAEVGELEASLDQLSRDGRRDQPETSRRLGEAAGEIRDNKIREKILYSRGVVQQRSKDYARNFEEHIEGTLGRLEERLGNAAGAIGDSREQRLERALEETRDTVTALESLEERLRAGGLGEQGDEGGTPQGGDDTPRPRQLRRELGQRTTSLERLGGDLRGEGVETADLDRIIGRLRELGEAAPGPEVLTALEAGIIRGLKEFEFALRRSLLPDDAASTWLADDTDVPEGFEEMVDKYYKALAERRQ